MKVIYNFFSFADTSFVAIPIKIEYGFVDLSGVDVYMASFDEFCSFFMIKMLVVQLISFFLVYFCDLWCVGIPSYLTKNRNFSSLQAFIRVLLVPLFDHLHCYELSKSDGPFYPTLA